MSEELDCGSGEMKHRLACFQHQFKESQCRARFEKKDLSSKLAKLEENYVKLVKGNAKIIGEVDAVKDELAKEKAENSSLKAELETTVLKVQTIAVDVVLSAWTELMEEFKKGEHASWDPDQEIQTWKKREAVLARGDYESKDEEDEGEPTLVAGSPKQLQAS